MGAPAVRLRYRGPHDLLEVPWQGEPIRRGETFTVVPELAGRGPHWRRIRDGERTGDLDTRERAGHREVLDLGEGLLAQPDNFEQVDDAPTASREG